MTCPVLYAADSIMLTVWWRSGVRCCAGCIEQRGQHAWDMSGVGVYEYRELEGWIAARSPFCATFWMVFVSMACPEVSSVMRSGLKYRCSSSRMMVRISSGRIVVLTVLRKTSGRRSKGAFVIRELCISSYALHSDISCCTAAEDLGAAIEKSS